MTVDFEQPRKLWQKVFDDTQKEHFVGNVSGHIKNVKSKTVLERQRDPDPLIGAGSGPTGGIAPGRGNGSNDTTVRVPSANRLRQARKLETLRS